MAFEERTVTTRSDEPNSMEVIRNAKGDYQWSIKAYGNGESFETLIQKIEAADEMLRRRFLATAVGAGEVSKLLRQAEEEISPPARPAKTQRAPRPLQEEPSGPEEAPPARRRQAPMAEESPAPTRKRGRKEALMEAAKKPVFRIEEEFEDEEPAPTFRRRRE